MPPGWPLRGSAQHTGLPLRPRSPIPRSPLLDRCQTRFAGIRPEDVRAFIGASGTARPGSCLSPVPGIDQPLRQVAGHPSGTIERGRRTCLDHIEFVVWGTPTTSSESGTKWVTLNGTLGARERWGEDSGVSALCSRSSCDCVRLRFHPCPELSSPATIELRRARRADHYSLLSDF